MVAYRASGCGFLLDRTLHDRCIGDVHGKAVNTCSPSATSGKWGDASHSAAMSVRGAVCVAWPRYMTMHGQGLQRQGNEQGLPNRSATNREC